jgi:hypothetical protein
MKKSIAFFLILANICLFMSQKAGAAGLCCQLSSGVQENLSGIAAPAAGDVSLQFNYSFTKMDKFKEGDTTRSLDEAKMYIKPDGTTYTSLPITMDMIKYTVTAAYGFSPKLKAFISLPYVRNTMDMTSDGGMMGWMDMTMKPVSGLGDASAMVLYRLYANGEIKPTDAFTLGCGVKAPTGSFTETKSSGKLIHAHMQPGTGSWDPLLSLVYTKMIEQFLLQSDVTYQYTTRNRQGYEFGDSTSVNLSAKYAVVRELNIGAGLTYLHIGKASDKNGNYYDPATNSSLMDDPANTGGRSIWLSPEIQAFPFKNGMVYAKYQVPVWEKVNGIQLVTDYRLLLGVSYVF